MPADTSSAPAGSSDDVDKAAAALASLRVEPRLARSEAAAETNSGAAIKNDISHLRWQTLGGSALSQVALQFVVTGNNRPELPSSNRPFLLTSQILASWRLVPRYQLTLRRNGGSGGGGLSPRDPWAM